MIPSSNMLNACILNENHGIIDRVGATVDASLGKRLLKVSEEKKTDGPGMEDEHANTAETEEGDSMIHGWLFYFCN